MFDGQPHEIAIYEKADGTRPYEEWVYSLRDQRAVARIEARLTRLQAGNPGDYKSLGEGVYELRVDYGPGYRVYFALAGLRLVILFCGVDKRSQQSDIATALKYWKDQQQRGQGEQS